MPKSRIRKKKGVKSKAARVDTAKIKAYMLKAQQYNSMSLDELVILRDSGKEKGATSLEALNNAIELKQGNESI